MRFAVVLLYPLVSLFFKRRWIDLDRIPARGPAIIAVNHISYADPLVFARFIWDSGRVPRFLAKASLFRLPLGMGRIVAGAGQIPVYRESTGAQQALADAVAALRRGEMVLIYPEGTVTRDPDFWPMQAKTGVARLALLAPDVPVIPVGQWGAQRFLDFYARRFRPVPRKQVTIAVGPPVDLSDYAGSEPTAQVLHEMTDRVMAAVRDLVAEIRGEQPPTEFYRRPAPRAESQRAESQRAESQRSESQRSEGQRSGGHPAQDQPAGQDQP